MPFLSGPASGFGEPPNQTKPKKNEPAKNVINFFFARFIICWKYCSWKKEKKNEKEIGLENVYRVLILETIKQKTKNRKKETRKRRKKDWNRCFINNLWNLFLLQQRTSYVPLSLFSSFSFFFVCCRFCLWALCDLNFYSVFCLFIPQNTFPSHWIFCSLASVIDMQICSFIPLLFFLLLFPRFWPKWWVYRSAGY